ALLAASDGFVLSSAWEGSPNGVMEALAAGKPVVATRVGGTPELVEDGSSGFLVHPHDPEVLAAAMLRVMALSREEWRAMGEAGRRYVEEHHNLERVALYVELLEAQR
ncbi:MAG: glycosyltransferase, partial [Firmicutes bacterium]|nr:glycosyltransferase [Bacillota bacterium]